MVEQVRLILAVWAGKTITALIGLLRLGAGSVFPGTIANRLQPEILDRLCRQVKHGIIIIAGTNGKTTTSLLLRQILERQGWRVAHNATGANLHNGLITALLESTDFTGKLKADYAILEVDENVVPKVLPQVQPKWILGLNLFRDQLDRYGEVDTISERWQRAIVGLPSDTVAILNADDPTLSYLGQKLVDASAGEQGSRGAEEQRGRGAGEQRGRGAEGQRSRGAEEQGKRVKFFGLSEPEQYLDEIPHAVDSIYCPSCGHSLEYRGVYLSHLGDYSCPSCSFSKGEVAIDSREWPQILIGIYNKYNTVAAALAAREIGIGTDTILETIANFQAAFGRAEELEVEGKKVRILLSKNPVGMNETIRAVTQIQQAGGASTTLIVLNDRIPDGTDVSWIWDVDTEKLVALGGTIVVSGDRVYDMALRLRYSQKDTSNGLKLVVKEDLPEAIATALEITPVDETLHILPTYSAMLEVRGLLTGRKIL